MDFLKLMFSLFSFIFLCVSYYFKDYFILLLEVTLQPLVPLVELLALGGYLEL